MTAAWPDDLPRGAVLRSIREALEKNVLEFQVDAGQALRRRRTSMAGGTLAFELPPISAAQWDVLLAFHRDDLADGTLEFTRTHPRDSSVTLICTFREPPLKQDIGGAKYSASISLNVIG